MRLKKKLLILLCLMLTVALVTLPAVSVSAHAYESGYTQEEVVPDNGEYENGNEDDFQFGAWFTESVLPILIAVLTGISAILLLIFPSIKLISKIIKKFEKSKEEYEETTQKVLNTQKEITDFKRTLADEARAIAAQSKKELEAIRQQTTEVLEHQGREIALLTRNTADIIRMNKIAFCNNEELVKNGYANEIMKVGVEDGN